MKKAIKVLILSPTLGTVPLLVDAHQCNYTVNNGGSVVHISITYSGTECGMANTYTYNQTVDGVSIASGDESDFGPIKTWNLPCCQYA
jgi:hypothetical protein